MVPRDLKHQNALASQPGAGATGSGKPYADKFHWTGVASFFHCDLPRRVFGDFAFFSEGWGDLFGGFAAVNWVSADGLKNGVIRIRPDAQPPTLGYNTASVMSNTILYLLTYCAHRVL
jgi:hypothetical protein